MAGTHLEGTSEIFNLELTLEHYDGLYLATVTSNHHLSQAYSADKVEASKNAFAKLIDQLKDAAPEGLEDTVPEAWDADDDTWDEDTVFDHPKELL